MQFQIISLILAVSGAAELGLVVPTLAYYVQQIGGNAQTMSFISMACTCIAMLGIPLWGRLSDLHGRKIVLLVCSAGISLSMLLLSFATSIPLVFAARMLTATFGGVIIAGSGAVADLSLGCESAVLAKRFGRSEASFGFGILVFGALLGAFLTKISFQVTYLAGFLLGALNFCVILFLFKETKKVYFLKDTKDSEQVERKSTKPVLKEVLSNSDVLGSIIQSFLAFLAGMPIVVIFAFFAKDELNLEASLFGAYIGVVGIFKMLTQHFLMERIYKRIRAEKIILMSTLISTSTLGAILVFRNQATLFICAPLTGFAPALMETSLNSIVTKFTSAAHKGLAVALVKVTFPIALFTAPLWATIYDNVDHFLPFYCSLAICTGSALFAALWPWNLQNPRSEAEEGQGGHAHEQAKHG